jgi:hypothetical protein
MSSVRIPIRIYMLNLIKGTSGNLPLTVEPLISNLYSV